jgi:hypothetical protein
MFLDLITVLIFAEDVTTRAAASVAQSTSFTQIYEMPENSRRQVDDLKQVQH